MMRQDESSDTPISRSKEFEYILRLKKIMRDMSTFMYFVINTLPFNTLVILTYQLLIILVIKVGVKTAKFLERTKN